MKKFLPVVAALALGIVAASAQSATPDASALVSTATTVANSVMALCLTVGGFFLVYKIIKWIRK